MNKIIPNNSICSLKKYFVRVRSNKILRITKIDSFDSDCNSTYIIKIYSSKKTISEEGSQLIKILLKPNS